MNYFRAFSLILFLFPFILFGQTENSLDKTPKTIQWGAIPALSYDSDLGIKYGAIFNLFDYSSAANSFDYSQYLYLKLTNTTKKTSQLQVLFESERLLKKALIFAELSYFGDKKLDFFGFNGTKSSLNYAYTDDSDDLFMNTLFYSYQRTFFRARFDIQKYLGSAHSRWLMGLNFQKYNIARPNFDNSLGLQTNLYANYLQWGLISPDEASGGNLFSVVVGYVYDTRNNKCYCTNGLWYESYLVYAPNLWINEAYLKSVLSIRFYKNIFDDRFSFSGRISAQNKLWGKIPFYQLNTYFDSRLNQEGIGGAYTLRGAFRNRIIADGFVLTNAEIKAKLYEFTLLQIPFMTALSFFSDFSYITQEYSTNNMKVPFVYQDLFFNSEEQKLNSTYGIGFYILFNQNNVISVNYGISPNKQLGKSSLYVGSSLLF